MSSSLIITLDPEDINSVKNIFRDTNISDNNYDIFKTSGSRLNIIDIQSRSSGTEKSYNWNKTIDSNYSYTMVVLDSNGNSNINIAIICQFNYNILQDTNVKVSSEETLSTIYDKVNEDKEVRSHFIYIPAYNYGVGKLLSHNNYNFRLSTLDQTYMLFKVFIINDITIKKSNTIDINLDNINRYDIIKNDIAVSSKILNDADIQSNIVEGDHNSLLFLLLYYINFHSFNSSIFDKLKKKFFNTNAQQKPEPVAPTGTDTKTEKKAVEKKEAKTRRKEAKPAREAERARKEAKAAREVENARKEAELAAREEELAEVEDDDNYKLEKYVLEEDEKDDEDYASYDLYKINTKVLIKYLFKNAKGSSNKKFNDELLNFLNDKENIAVNDFIYSIKNQKIDTIEVKNAGRIWFNYEFPNITSNKKDILNATKKKRYIDIYNTVAKEEKARIDKEKARREEAIRLANELNEILPSPRVSEPQPLNE